MTSTLSPMDPRRCAAVRAVLGQEAAPTRPPQAGREPARASRPRRRPLGRRALLGSASAGAAAAVVAVVLVTAVLVTADPAAPPSYASWTAVPATAPGGTASDEDIETWASACTDLGVGGIGIQGVGARREDAATRTPLVDRRGDFTYCVDIDPGTGTRTDPFIALSGIRAHDLNRAWVNTMDRPVQAPGAGEVIVVAGDDRPLPDEEPGVVSLRAYQLFGTAGPGVTGVDILLRNGLRITATVQHGIWGAWWPAERGEPTDSRLDVHTATGTRTLTTDTLRLP